VNRAVQIRVAENEMVLLPEKVVFFPGKRTLLLSDLHLGKANHFRRAGIPVPLRANKTNLENLISLALQHKPQRIIFLGDLFHSHYNSEWESFGQLVQSLSDIRFELVTGNHDILSERQYVKYGIVVHEELFLDHKILLRHEPLDASDGLFRICGHIHPAITLRGKGRDSETFPCFWISNNQMVLPAFGAFTGRHPVTPKKSDQIYFIAGKQVIDAASLNGVPSLE